MECWSVGVWYGMEPWLGALGVTTGGALLPQTPLKNTTWIGVTCYLAVPNLFSCNEQDPTRGCPICSSVGNGSSQMNKFSVQVKKAWALLELALLWWVGYWVMLFLLGSLLARQGCSDALPAGWFCFCCLELSAGPSVWRQVICLGFVSWGVFCWERWGCHW